MLGAARQTTDARTDGQINGLRGGRSREEGAGRCWEVLEAAEEKVWGGRAEAAGGSWTRAGRKTTDRLKQCEIIAGRYDDNVLVRTGRVTTSGRTYHAKRCLCR